jgi:LacI family transcriptional regulator
MKKSPPIQKARVTLADVARSAGVSLSTVSLVLNDKPLAKNLAAATRQRIRHIAEQLSYRPDAAARSLRSRRSQLIGVMVFDIADPYCTLILQGIQETLGDTAMLPIIMDAHNQRQQFSRYLGMAVEHHVEGLIVVANWLFVDIEALRTFERNGIPTAIVGREFPSPSIGSVLVDNETGGRLAFEHLHELGHRQIAVVRGPERLQDSGRRWQGIQRAAEAAKVKLDMRLVLQLPETADPVLGYAGGYGAAKQLIASGRGFTGVLAFDDLTAFGVIRGLHEAGLHVPEDVSVVGFDDIPQAILTMPSLTTVSQHMREMGKAVTEHVLESITSKTSGKQPKSFTLLHPPTLIARESTARVARGRGRRR